VSRPKPKPRARSKKAPKPRAITAEQDLDQLWAASRHGAHNVAGVRYQIVVGLHLLIEGYARTWPIVALTPEGLEDLDCELDGGEGLLVQAKERSDPVGFSLVADFIAHAGGPASLGGHKRIALATNASVDPAWGPTGWDTPLLASLGTAERQQLAQAFPTLQSSQLDDLLARTHVVVLPERLDDHMALRLADLFAMPPSHAAIAVAVLLTALQNDSAAQRHTSPRNAARWLADRVRVECERLRTTIDPTQLHELERAGSIASIDFGQRSDISPEQFLEGVDVRPLHIAARLDIARPTELSEVRQGLIDHRYALIVGPSGSGKSGVLWRTAYDLTAERVRAFRVRSLSSDRVGALLRYVDLQHPTPETPVLICIDDLGRPGTVGWEEAAPELLERPGVLLVGAAREEDFRPALAARQGVVVRPRLDETLARGIADTLGRRGVETQLAPEEAFRASEGLLMEYLSLLLSGQRLEAVVGEQADDLLRPDRSVEREVVRVVCAADVLETSLPPDALKRVVSDLPALPSALNRAHREHLIVQEDDGRWGGLHELRSQAIIDRLHAAPPPTVETTYATVLELLPADERARTLEIAASTAAILGDALVATVASFIQQQEPTATVVEELMVALARADVARHARLCLEVIDRARPPGMSSTQLALVAFPARFGGVEMPMLPEAFQQLVRDLPDAPTSLRALVAESVGPQRFGELAAEASPEAAVGLLEALEGAVELPLQVVQHVLMAHQGRPERQRFAETLRRLSPGAGPLLQEWLGPPKERLHQLSESNPSLLDWTIEGVEDGGTLTVRVRLQHTDPGTTTDHERAVSMAGTLRDLFPEAEAIDVTTVGLDGGELIAMGMPIGRVSMKRANIVRHTAVSPIPLLVRAAQRLRAQTFWTERLRLQARLASELIRLLTDMPALLLNPHWNTGRERDWKAAVQVFTNDVARLPPVIADRRTRVASAAPEKADHASQALHTAGMALGQVRDVMDQRSTNTPGAAAQLREAALSWAAAVEEGAPPLSGIGESVPAGLLTVLDDAAGMLYALSARTALFRNVRLQASETWVLAARRVTAEVRDAVVDHERRVVDRMAALAPAAGEVARVSPRAADKRSLMSDRWVILVNMDGGGDWDHGAFMATAALSDDDAVRLAFRVIALPTLDGAIVGGTGVALGHPGLFPIAPDDARGIAEELGRPVLEGGTIDTVDRALGTLLEISALLATIPIVRDPRRAAERRAQAEALVPTAHELIATLPSGELHEALTALVAEVDAEVSGTDAGALARGLAATIRTGNGTNAAALWGWIRWRAVQAEHRRRDMQ
jgi:hypothetical protein